MDLAPDWMFTAKRHEPTPVIMPHSGPDGAGPHGTDAIPTAAYPLIVPKVRPLRRCRCITPMKSTIGARMPTAPAADQDQYSIRSAPYWAIATERGFARFPVRMRQ